MKPILILIFMVVALAAKATTYYISTTGLDSNNGTNSETPWQTLNKVNTTVFSAGDIILFKRGDSWTGTLRIKQSGTFANRITFGAYGSGNNPVINGFTTVSSWSNLGNNIWESTNTVSTLSTCNLVSINGNNTPMGRWPNLNSDNGGYSTYDSHTGNTSITATSLSGQPDWTGAEVVIRTNAYIIDRRTITSQSGTTLNWSTATSFDLFATSGFFIQNDSLTLDAQNEWFYSPTRKKIQVYSTSQPSNVTVSSLDTLVFCNQDYVTIRDLTLQGANKWAIYNTSTKNYIEVRHCNIQYCGQYGINSVSHHFTVDSCTISDINNMAAILGSNTNYCKVSNNSFNRIGLYPGMGIRGDYSGISNSNAKGLIIEYNSLKNTGFNPITVFGDSIFIRYNFVDTFNTILHDGGGIYVARASLPNGTEVRSNIVLHGLGNYYGTTGTISQALGIYVDVLTSNYRIINNTVAHCGAAGIMVSGCYNTVVRGNTVYDCMIGLQWNSGAGTAPLVGRHDTVTYNTLICTKITGNYRAMKLNAYTAGYYDSIPKFAYFDYNKYGKPLNDYPLDHDYNAMSEISGTTGPTFMTLAQWQTFAGMDWHSSVPPQGVTSLNDLYFYYNFSSSAKVQNLPVPMLKTDGGRYSTSINIPAYSGVVLYKDYNPLPIEVESKNLRYKNKILIFRKKTLKF